MASVFTKIIRGELPSYDIYDDNFVYAFLDHKPHNPGHVLIVPKREVADYDRLPLAYLQSIFMTAQRISKAIKKVTGCEKVGMMVNGMGVKEHMHVHMIPLFEANDMDQDKAHQIPESEMKAIHKKIKTALEGIKK